MDREIKFRAWDKNQKCYFYRNFVIYPESGDVEFPEAGWDLQGYPDLNMDLEQYTGLKDCKRTEEFPEGQPIFEGDIIRYKDIVQGLVIFHKYRFCIDWNIGKYKPDDFMFDPRDMDSDFVSFCSVVGNINEGVYPC